MNLTPTHEFMPDQPSESREPINDHRSYMKTPTIECHGLDTPDRVCFYEQDYYVLSNFSSFTLQWKGLRFDTSEAAYHWEKFPNNTEIRHAIRTAPSAHEAYQIAFRNREDRRADWDDVKVEIMRDILYAKVEQHEYVKRKLLATGERELVENSWRDDFWGWGPNRDGQNELGKLWMDIRAWLVIEAMTPAQVEEYLVANGYDMGVLRKKLAGIKAQFGPGVGSNADRAGGDAHGKSGLA